jgi:hypothetical protein
MRAFADHMIAPLSFFDKHSTLWASFPLKIILLILISAISLMLLHHALLAELDFAFIASIREGSKVYESLLTVLRRANSNVRI